MPFIAHTVCVGYAEESRGGGGVVSPHSFQKGFFVTDVRTPRGRNCVRRDVRLLLGG